MNKRTLMRRIATATGFLTIHPVAGGPEICGCGIVKSKCDCQDSHMDPVPPADLAQTLPATISSQAAVVVAKIAHVKL